MFRSFIYLNEEKMLEYKSILEGNEKFKKRNTKSISKAAISTPIASAEVELDDNSNEEKSQNISLEYHNFEKELSRIKEDAFWDLTNISEEFSIANLPSMSILKLRGFIEVPEKFDLYNLITEYQSIVFGAICPKSKNEEVALEFLKNANPDIPILIDYEDFTLSGKLNTKWLIEEYTELETYEELEVTILCKIEGYVNKESVEIYNPTKDFVRLNRTMRRTANFGDNEYWSPITINGPVIKSEIIAIYK